MKRPRVPWLLCAVLLSGCASTAPAPVEAGAVEAESQPSLTPSTWTGTTAGEVCVVGVVFDCVFAIPGNADFREFACASGNATSLRGAIHWDEPVPAMPFEMHLSIVHRASGAERWDVGTFFAASSTTSPLEFDADLRALPDTHGMSIWGWRSVRDPATGSGVIVDPGVDFEAIVELACW